MTSEHVFSAQSAHKLRFKACSICDETIVFLAANAQGLQCAICKKFVHESCVERATPKSLPCKFLSATKAVLPQELRPIRYMHGLGMYAEYPRKL